MFPKSAQIGSTRVKLARRKPSKTALKKKADKLCGDIVRARGHCENPDCKHPGMYALQWAHILSRSYLNTRWMPENAFCLCAGCHMYFTNHPAEWEVFVETMIGRDHYIELRRKALEYNKTDYDAILEDLRSREMRETTLHHHPWLSNFREPQP